MTEEANSPERNKDSAKRVFTVDTTGIATLLDKRPRPIRRTLRVTEDGLDALLEGKTHLAPNASPDTYPSLSYDITGGAPNRHHAHGNGNGGFDDDDIAFDDNNRFVGRDPRGKTPPVHPLETSGPNPFGARHFVADEFPGMLTFDPKGKPTLLSRFPEAQSLEDIKEIRINIASTLPEYMTGNTSQAIEVKSMEEEAFAGKPLEEAFRSVDDKMIAQVKKYAREFEQAYGVKITLGTDLPDPHLSLMGYDSDNANLLGFATFPPSINEWPEMEGLGDHPGYLLLNNKYTESATRKECYDLFSHEFGHTLGLAHPHDIAVLRMDRREALTATKMAYTDLKIDSFMHQVTDGKGKPVLSKSGAPQFYTEGPDEGVLDFGLRKWLGNPPVMGKVTQPDPKAPDCDLYKANFDLKTHFAHALKVNARSIVFTRERLLPMVPMLNSSEHTVLSGTDGDDILDTNPGYSSTVTDPKTGVHQRFTLVDGHFGKVLGVKGNNTIIPSQKGDQEIQPGPGRNQIQFLYRDMQGHKTILSKGQDTLVITEEALKQSKLKAETLENGNLRLVSADASITLGGKGIQQVNIINEQGRPLASLPAEEISEAALNKLFDARRKAEKPNRRTAEPAETIDPDAPPVETRDRIPTGDLRKGRLAGNGSWASYVKEGSGKPSGIQR